MAGSSVAAPAAAAWITDFLNASYYARPAESRAVSDLRFAHGIVTTRWVRAGRRLGARDIVALNRAFGRVRFLAKGRLDREALVHGARRLLGDWFPAAWEDDERRAYGVAFETPEERRAFAPEQRLVHAALGPLTPPLRSPGEQHWATYDPVALPDAGAALELLLAPERWPDMGAEAGRFTALRRGGLEGQTFEIEVAAKPAPRLPVFMRGYVTCTSLHVRDDGAGALDEAVADLDRPLPRGSRRRRRRAAAAARRAARARRAHDPRGPLPRACALAAARVARWRGFLDPRRRCLGSAAAAPRRDLPGGGEGRAA